MPLRMIVAVILLCASGGLGWLAYQALNPSPAAAVSVPRAMVRVLVAAQPLQTGVLLKDSDVREREMPSSMVPEGAIHTGEDALAEIRGAMLRRYLNPGDPLVRGEVLRPRDRGFLAAVLTPGTRAVSIGVDAKTGASGLISPGDIVDVILTQEFQRSETPARRRVVAETVLNNIRVIAVDQQIAQGAASTPAAPTASGGAHRVASTVTLQVTPEQSERVAVAERLGRLVLTVRPIEGDSASQPAASAAESAAAEAARVLRPGNALMFGSDVSSALGGDEPSAMPRMRVIQGTTRSDVVFR